METVPERPPSEIAEAILFVHRLALRAARRARDDAEQPGQSEPAPAVRASSPKRRLSPRRLAKWEAQWQAESEAES